MIQPMKKYTFLVYHKDYESFIQKLYDIGVVQVVEKESVKLEDEDLERNFSLIKRYNGVKRDFDYIAKNNDIKEFSKCVDDSNDIDVIELYDNIKSKEDTLNQELLSIRKEINALKPWGEFDAEKLNDLAEYGFHVNYYSVQKRNFDENWYKDYNAIIVSEAGSLIYFTTLTPQKDIEINADLVKLPENNLSHYKNLEADVLGQLKLLEEEKIKLVREKYHTLECELNDVQTDFDFDKVRVDTQDIADQKVKVLEGWVPKVKEEDLLNMLNQNQVLYTSREATKKDKAPILLKNKKLSSLFEPIGDLYDLPAYGEIDLTPFFAPFYMMFFGLCLGDAGYGIFLLIVGWLLKRKKPKLKKVMNLVMVLGVATMIFGTISGTFFGISLLDVNLPWFEKFKAIMLDSDQLFTTSLIIGCVQIIFGMFIKVFNRFKTGQPGEALSTIGWLTLILGCVTTYILSSKGIITASTSKILYIVICSVAAVFIFILNNLKRNVFVNIGLGLWDTYNMATGLLGDVLSYIRLFALGISGSVMGFVFNDLAISLSPNIPVLKQIVMLIILIIGHGMNIFMSGLSAFVHPMRLTFVEFYKNAGFTGGGKKYEPFGDKHKLVEQEIDK
jgi:V/A-type H+-transporting ATPase subunit I